ncbi:hypothetical protein ACFONG_07415 [Uliginosibacterium paludis]|uniref:DUF1631 family protein n=1 Tax=Uliginosibacterium paludis TaxID=1615952 RepID=A0ABV2CKZ0_9RHOO
MTRSMKSVDYPPGFNKCSFLMRLRQRIDRYRNSLSEVSPLARLYIELVADACLTHYERQREDIRRWMNELIEAALVGSGDDPLEAFRRRLEQEEGWWPMVSLLWQLHCSEIAQDIPEILQKHFQAKPDCTPTQMWDLGVAVMQLTPKDLFGEAFIDALNEPLITSTYNEEVELGRLAEGLVDFIQARWPDMEGSDPWASLPEPDGGPVPFSGPLFNNNGAPLWHEMMGDDDEDGDEHADAAPVQAVSQQSISITIRPLASLSEAKPESDRPNAVMSKRRRSMRAGARAPLNVAAWARRGREMSRVRLAGAERRRP